MSTSCIRWPVFVCCNCSMFFPEVKPPVKAKTLSLFFLLSVQPRHIGWVSEESGYPIMRTVWLGSQVIPADNSIHGNVLSFVIQSTPPSPSYHTIFDGDKRAGASSISHDISGSFYSGPQYISQGWISSEILHFTREGYCLYFGSKWRRHTSGTLYHKSQNINLGSYQLPLVKRLPWKILCCYNFLWNEKGWGLSRSAVPGVPWWDKNICISFHKRTFFFLSFFC